MFIINVLMLCLAFCLLATPAYAYLDPGSGSFILQLAVGAVLGGLVTIRLYFQKLKSYLAAFRPKGKKHESAQRDK